MSKKIIGNTMTTPVPRSDWAQHDASKADYIKNRTHYESKELTTLWTDAVFTTGDQITNTTFNDQYHYSFYQAPSTFDYEYIYSNTGDRYIVTVNGVNYEVEYQIMCIGFTEYIEGKLPIMISEASMGSMCIYGREPNKTYTISVKKVRASFVKQLDEKFIPDTIARKSDLPGGGVGNEFILHSTTEGSDKQFKITVDDTGTLTVTEIE